MNLCWWPVGSLQAGTSAIACGDPGTETRIHPLCGCSTSMCVEHAVEFDRVMVDADLSPL